MQLFSDIAIACHSTSVCSSGDTCIDRERRGRETERDWRETCTPNIARSSNPGRVTVSLSIRNVGTSRLFGCLPLVGFEILEDNTFLVQLSILVVQTLEQQIETQKYAKVNQDTLW